MAPHEFNVVLRTTTDEFNVLPKTEGEGGQFDPLGFFIFSPKPPGIFRKKIGNPRGFNVWSFDGQINVGDRSYPKLWGKYKKTYLRFSLISLYHNYLLISHIIVWFYNIFMILNWNSKKILKILVYIKIFSFQDHWLFTFHVITSMAEFGLGTKKGSL